MHRDAKRAMIGIGVDRMCKRYMDNRQQHKQDQAHRYRHPQSAWLWEEIAT
jgi:hypothetical protein